MTAVASVTVLGSLISIFDTTIVQVAVPSLVRNLHTSLATVQWVTTIYLLALALVVPLTRWATDRFGTKNVWMASMSLFLIGSLLCGLSPSIVPLICFRALQGVGGGMLLPTGQTILTREAGPERLGRVMSVVGIPSMLGPLLGPIFGGLILSAFSWRFIFFVNLPLGAIALVRGAKILAPGDTGTSRRLDVVGLLLLPPGLCCCIYAISTFGNAGHVNRAVAASGLAGGLLLTAFAVHAFRSPEPLLDLRLWRNRALLASQATMFLYGCGINAVLFLVQLYYQLARGATPLLSSLLVAPSAFGAMAILPFAGKIMDRRGSRGVVIAGLALVCLGVLPLTQVGPRTSELFLSACWFFRGVGVGATATPATAAGYTTLRRDEVSGATTLTSIIQYFGGALGVAVVAVILQRRVQDFLPGGGGVQALSHLSPARIAELGAPLAHAFGTLFWFTVALSLAAMVPALLLPRRPPKIDHSVTAEQPVALSGNEA
jgi:EmrB/QacA subfamily drug resistance transporter